MREEENPDYLLTDFEDEMISLAALLLYPNKNDLHAIYLIVILAPTYVIMPPFLHIEIKSATTVAQVRVRSIPLESFFYFGFSYT